MVAAWDLPVIPGAARGWPGPSGGPGWGRRRGGIAALEALTPGAVVRGLRPNATVSVVAATWFGDDAIELTFMFPVVLGQSNAQTLTVFVAQFVTCQQVEWGYLCAASVLIVAPIVVFVLALQGQHVRGITAGSLK